MSDELVRLGCEAWSKSRRDHTFKIDRKKRSGAPDYSAHVRAAIAAPPMSYLSRL